GGWVLGYRLLEGRCGTGEAVAYLEGLSREVAREGVRGVVFQVAYLPRYSPHLNPVESVWRRVKGFLMPRRHYGSVGELRRAVAEALERLRERMRQEVLQGLCVGT
ncbi:transposase, partial [Thermus sp.]|uniref:transposase n=1 Tax=Thermus sp. TaxID=275 RepID=UPI003D153005